MAKTDEFNAWETSSGLADEYEGVIKDSYFEFDDDYMDGDVLVLKLDIQTDDPEVGMDGNVTELYPAGKGWDTKDKGKTAVHEKPNKKFNRNSGVGLLINAALDTDAADLLKSRGVPMEAGIWKGLKFRFERKEFDGTFDGEKSTWTRMLPVEFIGEVSGSKKPAKKGAKKAEVDTDESGDDAEADAPSIPAKLKVALKKLAKECEDHDEFVERAMTEIEGVEGDEAAEAVVLDDSEDGLFAQANA